MLSILLIAATFWPQYGYADANSGQSTFLEACAAGMRKDPPAIKALKTYLRRNPGPARMEGHKISRNRGEYTLKVGVLADEFDLMILAMAAIYEGSLHIIDAGEVVSPKVIALFEMMSQDLLRRDSYVSVRGRLNARQLEVARSSAPNWTPRDSQRFERALELFKIREACQQIWQSPELTECNDMRFEFQLGRESRLRWR